MVIPTWLLSTVGNMIWWYVLYFVVDNMAYLITVDMSCIEQVLLSRILIHLSSCTEPPHFIGNNIYRRSA